MIVSRTDFLFALGKRTNPLQVGPQGVTGKKRNVLQSLDALQTWTEEIPQSQRVDNDLKSLMQCDHQYVGGVDETGQYIWVGSRSIEADAAQKPGSSAQLSFGHVK